MADLLGEDFALTEIHKLYECHERLLEHKAALSRCSCRLSSPPRASDFEFAVSLGPPRIGHQENNHRLLASWSPRGDRSATGRIRCGALAGRAKAGNPRLRMFCPGKQEGQFGNRPSWVPRGDGYDRRAYRAKDTTHP